MTIEQIEIRKILTQMLSDNGINRTTILNLVKEVLDEKLNRAIQQVLHQTNVDEVINRRVIEQGIQSNIKAEIANKVKAAFSHIHVTVHATDMDMDF